jgi:hypothetical protein
MEATMRRSTKPLAKKKLTRIRREISQPVFIIRSMIALLVVAVGVTVTAYSSPDDRLQVKDANGLALSEVKGYEDWVSVGPSQVEEGAGQRPSIKLTVANPTMINAYREGIPLNGKPFPDGSKIVKIEWTRKNSAEAPYSVSVPDALRKVGLIMKDSKRFPATHGWGYAQFMYDPATGKFSPEHTDPDFAKVKCHTCHLAVAAKDYIFTDFAAR